MKKFLWMIGVIAISPFAGAEQLTFVTTMSGPVGSFSQVESHEGATAQQVTLYQTGTINLEGNSQLGAVNLNGGTLSGRTPEFRAKELKVGAGGTVKGLRLIADKMDVASPTTLVVNGTLYSNGQTLTVNRAGATNMNITNTAEIRFDANRQPGNTLGWAANTQTPSGADSRLAGQILLKSAGNTASSTPNPTKKRWLSPLAYCEGKTFNLGYGDRPDSGAVDCNSQEVQSRHWYGSNLNNGEISSLKNDGWLLGEPTGCQFKDGGVECSTCDTSKKYFVNRWPTIGKQCWQGNVKYQRYILAYATCQESESNPFADKTTLNPGTNPISTEYLKKCPVGMVQNDHTGDLLIEP